jgi:ribonuclease G
MGLICRTAAEQKGGQDLHQDILELQAKWEKIFKVLPTAKVRDRLVGEARKSFMIIRDMLSFEFSSITVNNKVLHDELKLQLETVNDELPKILKLYTNKENIFASYGIDKAIKASFGKTVSCAGGSYLIIEHTEAMHTIDVNSGSKQNRSKSQEENALATNIDAALEIATQLRLRDMGGIIVIDFIDLRTPKFKKELYNTLKNAMEHDMAKHTILPMSKFGLIQITRQRVRPAMSVVTTESCPTCQGTGKVTSSLLIIDEIEKHVDYLLNKAKHNKLSLTTNPYLVAYIKSGFPSLRMRWFSKYKKWINISADSNCGMLEYHFHDAKGEAIDIDK